MSTIQKRYFLEEQQEKQLISFLQQSIRGAETTFTVFEHDGFYSAHENSAILAAKEIFKSTSALKSIGDGEKRFPTVYLSPLNFESFARDLLLIRQYRLEVYKKFKSSSSWELAYKASPGNLTEVEELLFSNFEADSNAAGVIALKHVPSPSGGRNVGIGFINAISKEIYMAEFEENEVFSNLQSAIIQLGAKECLVPKMDQSTEINRLNEILKRNGVLVSHLPKKVFQTRDIVQDMGRLIKKTKKTEDKLAASIAKEISEKSSAASCIAACIHYLEMMDNESNFDQYTFKLYDLSQYMKLDKSAYSALNLFSVSGTSSYVGGVRKMADSLYSLLDHCKTQQGKRLLSQWIKQPLLDVSLINERLNLVEAFVSDTALRLTIFGEHLKNFPDLCRLSKRFHKKAVTLQDCYKVYMALKSVPNLCECLAMSEDYHPMLIREAFTAPFQEVTHEFEKFKKMMETTLDFAMIEQYQFRVRAEFDPVLQDIKHKMEEVETEMQDCFDQAAADLHMEKGKGVKFESNAQFGHFFRVTCKEEKVLRSKKHYRTIDTKKDGVRFVTDKLQQLSDSYLDHQKSYEQQQVAIVDEIIGIAAGYADPMLRLGNLIAKLDVLISFSQSAANAPIPYVKPTMSSMEDGKETNLEECRHPCLECQDGVSFIPNDIKFSRDSKSFLIITGPNMGGKSTYIRQAGMTILMAQIGCFVPCSKADVTVVDAILARVGAGDCQIRGVSTFMAEMLEASSILRSATANSFIIIDELGRGTSTYDGFGLAWAISHHIATKIKCYCMFATHFHELTALEDEVQSVTNLHVTALTGDFKEESTLTMLYQVKPGVCDQSFGIHVAESVGFPKRVIETAKQEARELEDYNVKFDVEDENDPEFARKKRKWKLEAEEVVRGFFIKLKQSEFESLSDDDAKAKLQKLRESLPLENPFIAGLLKISKFQS